MSLKPYERHPSALRQALTEHEVSAREPLAKFVGIKAYEKAGGVVRRDLFQQEDEGVMLDSELLRQLAVAEARSPCREGPGRGRRMGRGASRVGLLGSGAVRPRAHHAASGDRGGTDADRCAECAPLGARHAT